MAVLFVRAKILSSNIDCKDCAVGDEGRIMTSKSDPMDLTNADTVDDLTRRCRELRAEVEVAAVREATLRQALEEAKDKVVDSFGVAYDAEDIDRWEAALLNPSPIAEAVGAVIEAVLKIRGLNVETCDCERCIENEGYSEKFWNTISELEFRIDAYTALLDGEPENTGDYRRARGVVPWEIGDPKPEEVIAKGRGRKAGDADGGGR